VEQNLVITQIVTAIITTIAQIATLVVVIIYTIYTARMTSAAKTSADAANQTINEMKEARDQENAPYIVVYFDLPINKHLIYLVIKNVGKSIAEDVKLTFIPSLSSTVFKGINDVPLIKNGISSIPPNYEIRTLFDGAIQRFGKTDLPLTYTVEVSYLGGLAKNRRASTQILDLSMFYGLMSVKEKDMDDLVKAVEDIAKHTDEINDNLEEVSESLTSGIWIKNSMLTVSAETLYPTSWGDSLITKLKEFQFLWKSTKSKEDERFINPFLSDLQNKIILIGEQIIVILSASPPSTPNVLIDNVGNVVAKLSDLGRKRFYIDGGRSTNEFNTLGDDIAKNIEDVIGQIQSVNFSLADNEEVFD